MTITYSAGLAAAVAAAERKKTSYANAIATTLGNTRRLILSKGGTVFLNVGMSGAMSATSGNITNFGVASGVTVRAAADLLVGGGILRIEGNGESYQATIGLSKAAQMAAGVLEANVATFDYYLPSNPTATSGYGFASGAKLKAPRFYASGTGPAAPTIKATTPTIVELVDWSNQANPVVVGIGTANNRLDDWVFEHPGMAAEIGDAALYTLDETIKWTSPAANQRFEFGALLMVAPNYNTESGTVQLEQMLCSFKPLGRWPTYPFMDTYVRADYTKLSDTPYPGTWGPCNNPEAADLTYPPPFKVNLYTVDGYKNGAPDRTPLFTHEMKAFYDKPAMPINSPLCSQAFTHDEPLLPHFNCGMQLPWQNIRTKKSAKAGTWFNGLSSYSWVNRTAMGASSSNACIPLVNGYDQINGQNNFYWMPLYPQRKVSFASTLDGGATNTRQAEFHAYLDAYDTTPYDPLVANRRTYDPQNFRATGLKYQPGSISGHDWRTGNGGVRFDRGAIPSQLAIWASDPNYVRPLGNVPARDFVEDWGLAYFNHSNHWIRDLKTFESLPKQESLGGHLTTKGNYYGGGPYGAMGQSRGPQLTIDLCGIEAGGSRTSLNNDATGRMPWGGWQRDSLHTYSNAAWYAILLNSPMHAIAAVHDFHTQWMVSLGASYPDADPTDGAAVNGPGGMFMVRSQAWRWLNMTLQWMVASSHPLSVSQSEVETRFGIELQTMYEKVMKPAFIDNDQRPYFVSIRNLGAPVRHNGTDAVTPGGNLMLYMAHVLVLLRQSGLMAKMRSKSAQYQFVFDKLIECMDKSVIDYCVDTDMRDNYYPIVVANKAAGLITAADIPANWAAQKPLLDAAYPTLAPGASLTGIPEDSPRLFQNFTLKYDGTYGSRYGAGGLFYQYMKARQIYFSEYPHARLNAAIAKMEGYIAAHDAAGVPWSTTFYPNYGTLNAPTELVPL